MYIHEDGITFLCCCFFFFNAQMHPNVNVLFLLYTYISRWFLNFLYFRNKYIHYFILSFVLLVLVFCSLVVNYGCVNSFAYQNRFYEEYDVFVLFLCSVLFYVQQSIFFHRVQSWVNGNVTTEYRTLAHFACHHHLCEKLLKIAYLRIRGFKYILPLSSLSLPLTKSHSLQQRHTHTQTKKLCQPHKRIIDFIWVLNRTQKATIKIAN